MLQYSTPTALEEATVVCASLIESSDNHVTLSDGATLPTILPASPDNRSRARQLWATDNSSSGKVNGEVNAEEQRVLVLEEYSKSISKHKERNSNERWRASKHSEHTNANTTNKSCARRNKSIKVNEHEHQGQRTRAQA